jgi:hypothetical protein
MSRTRTLSEIVNDLDNNRENMRKCAEDLQVWYSENVDTLYNGDAFQKIVDLTIDQREIFLTICSALKEDYPEESNQARIAVDLEQAMSRAKEQEFSPEEHEKIDAAYRKLFLFTERYNDQLVRALTKRIVTLIKNNNIPDPAASVIKDLSGSETLIYQLITGTGLTGDITKYTKAFNEDKEYSAIVKKYEANKQLKHYLRSDDNVTPRDKVRNIISFNKLFQNEKTTFESGEQGRYSAPAGFVSINAVSYIRRFLYYLCYNGVD